jgi:hypothetical protein
MTFVKDLDTPLLRLSPNDYFSLRDACAGVHAFGQIGGGKTYGAKVLAGAYPVGRDHSSCSTKTRALIF